MSASVESRIVTMKFDNTDFQKNVSTTLSALDKLKASMNFGSIAKTATTGLGFISGALSKIGLRNPFSTAQKGVSDLQKSASSFTMSGLEGGISHISKSFLAMATVGITAISQITSAALSAGAQMVKSLTVAPVTSGLHEYETNLNSIQTILANTKVSGANLDDVNRALNDLNHYSDKTIYNFSEMAKNIGTFTAAGVDLKTATSSIKGIANLAALSGSNSQQASSAMYQLSQEIAAGRVSLMGWNSVVNAGMGGSTFQRALVQTAQNMGQLSGKTVEFQGKMKNAVIDGQSFRDSIMAKPGEQSWLTSKVLTKTLEQFTGDMTDAELAAQGFSKAQIKAIQAQARTAVDAATKVKTLSGVIDTAREVAGSGWAKTWQLVFGDFKEARQLFTNMSNTVNSYIQKSADARNKTLKDWAKLGGRTDAIEAVKNVFKALGAVLGPIHDAFRDIFPRTTGAQLAAITKAFRQFTEGLILSKGAQEDLQSVFRALFSVIKIGVAIIGGLFKYFFDLVRLAGQLVPPLLNVAGAVADVVSKFLDWSELGNRITSFFNTVVAGRRAALEPLIDVVNKVVNAFAALIGGDHTAFVNKMQAAWEMLGDVMDNVLGVFDTARQKLNDLSAGLGDQVAGALSSIGDAIASTLGALGGIGSAAGSKLGGLASLFDFGNTADAAEASVHGIGNALEATGNAASTFGGLWSRLMDSMGGFQNVAGNILDGLGEILSALGDRLVDWVKNMDFEDVLAIINTGFFIAMYRAFSKFADNLGGVANSMSGVLDQVTSNLKTMQTDVKADVILKIAGALALLAVSLLILSTIDGNDLVRSLGAVATLLALLVGAIKVLEKEVENSIGSARLLALAFSIGALAGAILIMSAAVALLGRMDTGELVKGLLATAGILAIIIGATAVLQKTGGAGQIGILAVSLTALAGALFIMSAAVALLGRMDTGELVKGLLATAGILAIIIGATAVLQKTGGAGQMLVAAAAIGILAVSLTAFAGALKLYSSINVGTLVKGGLKVAATLIGIGLAMRLMPKNMIATAAGLLILSGALVVIAGAMKIMGKLSVEEMAKSLIMLGGSMLIIAVGLNAMTGAIAGAAAMLVFAGVLALLVPSLVILGNMDISTIAIALGALAGVFVVLGLAGLVLAPVAPVLIVLAGAIALLGAAALAVGLGMAAFAAGLATLATLGGAGAVALTGIVIALAETFPLIMQQFGLGLRALAKVIAESGPQLVQALSTVLDSLIQAVIDNTPKFGRMLWLLIHHGLRILRKSYPDFVDTGFAMLDALLDGIDKHIEKITRTVGRIIVKFINELSKQLPDIIDAGFNLIIAFINGMADAIDKKSERMGRAGKHLGEATARGAIKGLGEFAPKFVQDASEMARHGMDALMTVVRNAISDARDAVRNMFSNLPIPKIPMPHMPNPFGGLHLPKAAAEVTDSASRIRAALDRDLNFTPTITPVLDLTQIQRDAALMTAMLTPMESYRTATGIASDLQAQAMQEVMTTAEVAPIKLEQNNYSPKALSDVEIYRQTKNLVSLTRKVID